ncbi:MAG: phosphopantothenoylcysteine decarboxylase [Chitinophagaceae bacterium BSSC1]|nr:MAG: phosphopantothenoylcysteine decarboxylase [Chitinophagaceae bacterium BSSC1]
MLQGKKILLGITASIAAYKSILLVRLLVKAGAEVRVIMTPAAKDFVSPLVLSTLTNHPVLIELAGTEGWSNHVQLGRWADLFVIAPLSCNSLAKMANGQCDNLLMASYLSATCPVMVAPAMDEDMWQHNSTKRNLQTLHNDGIYIMPVETGELASGLFGPGRMAEPETILHAMVSRFFRKDSLKGKRALVTAGPTFEAIDPVRFIGNHSSGQMGFALAEALYLQGADVVLVTGPTALTTAYAGIGLVSVVSAAEMFEACNRVFANMDIAILSAAVADYKMEHIAQQKIKKTNQDPTLQLVKTKDILAHLGASKKPGQFVVGFALETENELENAQKKRMAKNADAIVLNSLNDKGAGFGSTQNQVTILDQDGAAVFIPLVSKTIVAEQIVSYIVSKIHA